MNAFFSPKSRVRTSPAVARLMNTLNLLGPALLLCAVILLVSAQFGNHLPEQRNGLLAAAALLVAAALVIRVAWGIGVRLIAARLKRRHDSHSPENTPGPPAC